MRFAPLVLALALSACAARQQATAPASEPSSAAAPNAPAPSSAPARAADAPLAAIDMASLSEWAGADHAAARAAFAASCPALLKREDSSGLTRPGDWTAPCTAAQAGGDARAFFEAQFAGVRVAGGEGFATGYFEPEIAGSRIRAPGYAHPLYRPPPDLIEADLGQWSDSLKGRRVRGRVAGQRLVPYHDRAAIDAGALSGRGLELAWAADPDELFFLEVQGSGRLRLPDGKVMRVGYAGQNGRDYTAIGRVLRERGELAEGQATMEGILGWLRTHPDQAAALRQSNKSYVFFRELTGPGPVGALGIALTPEASAAADPVWVPLGAPVWLTTTTAEGSFVRLLAAQDTGGAIKGQNRFDIFFGAGARARTLAGTQAARADAVLLLPRAAVERLRLAP